MVVVAFVDAVVTETPTANATPSSVPGRQRAFLAWVLVALPVTAPTSLCPVLENTSCSTRIHADALAGVLDRDGSRAAVLRDDREPIHVVAVDPGAPTPLAGDNA